MSGSGADGAAGLDLGSGSTGNLTDSAPSGFAMPDGSGNTLFSMPNGGAAIPGQVQSNPMSMGMGVMNGSSLSGLNSGFGPNASSAFQQFQQRQQGGAKQSGQGAQSGAQGFGVGMMGGRSTGSINFLPSSAITIPYTLSSGPAQSLLQQIMNRNKLNPTG
jgi:hypothetical protein